MQLKKKRAVISYDGNQVCYSTRTAITNSKPSVGSINEKRDFFFFFFRNFALSLGEAGNEEGQENGGRSREKRKLSKCHCLKPKLHI